MVHLTKETRSNQKLWQRGQKIHVKTLGLNTRIWPGTIIQEKWTWLAKDSVTHSASAIFKGPEMK